MVFSSLTFLFIFLPVVIGIYFLMPNRGLKNLVLLVSSLFFYAWGEPVYVILIFMSSVNDYVFAILVEKEREGGRARRAKLFFMFSLTVNLGLLFFFKYSGFIISNLNNFFPVNIGYRELPLPIGISFYTFQTMSYSIDVYRGKLKAQKNFLTMATYVTLFPQLIAGPIVRYITIEKELESRTESLEGVAGGMRRFIIGLGKKVLIANQMGIIADTVFNNYSEAGTLLTWFALISYSLQIYYDFSGYSDMAIGLGRVFGFNFLENFDYPYISRSITEFWRRWHISLGSWFRDYVYIPLGGNREKQLRNLFIVWFLTGFWHGANWNFIIWGLYYGLLLAIEKYYLKDLLVKMPKVFQHFYALFFIVVGWVFFRIEDLSQLGQVLTNMFIYREMGVRTLMFSYQEMFYAVPFFLVAILGTLPIFKNLLGKIEGNKKLRLENVYDLYLVGILFISIIFLVGETFNPFIYFKF